MYVRSLFLLNVICVQFICYAQIYFHSTNPAFFKNYETGRLLLANALHDKQLLTVLNNDHTLLLQFPFDAYELKCIPQFGYMYLDTINDYIKNFLRRNIPWESAFTALIEKAVRPGSVAIDIGAHIGTHSITLSRSVGSDGIVYAFEPQNKIFAELYMNMIANQCDNIIPLHCALGNEEGVVKMCQDVPHNEGASYVMKSGEGQETIILRLDDFHFSKVSFIKIDTENTEHAVLMGAYNTIMINRPIILIEIQGNGVRAERNQENMQEQALQVKNLLHSFNYDVHHLGNADYLALPRAL